MSLAIGGFIGFVLGAAFEHWRAGREARRLLNDWQSREGER